MFPTPGELALVLDTPNTAAIRDAARVAGLCYVVVIALGVSQATLVVPRLPGLDDPTAVVSVVADQSPRFRLGVLGDTVLYTLVLVLAAALYVVVRPVHRPLALGALVLRSAEAVLGLTATVVGGGGPLLLLAAPDRVDPASIVALLAVRESALDVILMLVGLGGAAFCYLFFLARLIPRALALWGVLTYGSMVILGISRIVWPSLPTWITSLLFAQGALFELLFGLWLVVKAEDVAGRASVPPPTSAT